MHVHNVVDSDAGDDCLVLPLLYPASTYLPIFLPLYLLTYHMTYLHVQIYWHRALFITVISTLTSFAWAPKEEREYPEEVSSMPSMHMTTQIQADRSFHFIALSL